MDVDAYVAAHRGEWQRLEELVAAASRGRRLDAAQADELVDLYQRVATHLSVVRSGSVDTALVARLSGLVARARAAATGAHDPAWRDVARFVTVTFPAALHRSARWWIATALLWVVVAAVIAAWVANSPQVQATIATPAEVRQLVDVEFARYYSENPAPSFAAKVWTNNAWVAAQALVAGVPTLGLYVLWVLLQNAANVAVAAGLMAANGRLALFFGLILPHGMLELTAVFVAAGAGLRLAWVVVDPGPRTRAQALAEEGRAVGALAVGLVGVLLVSGVVEAFVTPSGLPAWARIGIGLLVELAFLAYVVVLGGRAVRAGETGDLAAEDAVAVLPTAG